jgi:hypothetical protein
MRGTWHLGGARDRRWIALKVDDCRGRRARERRGGNRMGPRSMELGVRTGSWWGSRVEDDTLMAPRPLDGDCQVSTNPGRVALATAMLHGEGVGGAMGSDGAGAQ